MKPWPNNEPPDTQSILTEVTIEGDSVDLRFGSSGCGYDRKLAPDFTPEVGMAIKLWGEIGRPIRGLMIGYRLIYYRTEEEEAERHKREVAAHNRKKAKEYVRDKAKNDVRIGNLPLEFQERIFHFRGYRPNWGRDFEGYELFCCEEAVRLAKALKTPEAVREFSKMNYEQQKAAFPEISSGHSGNTFAQAVRLAHIYLSEPGLVPKMHGALCPLVGCEDYGCYSVRATEEEKNEVPQ